MSQHILSEYQTRLEGVQAGLKTLNRRFLVISYSRLAVFLLGILLTYGLFGFHTGLALFAGGISLFFFLYLIQWHSELAAKKQYEEHYARICAQEIQALAGDMGTLDTGEEFVDSKHAYSFDLDIFGRASVFQFINRSCTILGKHRLATWLREPLTEPAEIRERQVAVQDLAARPDFSHRFQALGQGKMETTEEPQSVLNWLNEPVFLIKNRFYRVAIVLLPLLLMFALLGWIAGSWEFFSALRPVFPARLVPLLIVINLFVAGTHLRRTNNQQAQLGNKSRTLNKYATLLAIIEGEDFTAPRLLALRQQLQDGNHMASQAIDRLSNIMAFLDQRLNMVAGILLNALLLWDLQCISRLEKWKVRHREKLAQWLEVVGELDALNSLGRFAYKDPALVFPEVLDGDFRMEAVQLGHFLIAAEKRVCNDVDIRKPGEFLVITGANMAGKSTFLRTVGVNLVLAMSGAPVCAKSFSFAPIPIMTSVRATDSLEDNESYFYAELLRLKAIIERLRESGRLFTIVDEMLRGTNSHDKQTGSRKFIEQLMHAGGAGLIATHDLSLGTLADEYPEFIRNKRFEVDILEDHLEFDYKLKDGISQNLNATFLMRQMGIMP